MVLRIIESVGIERGDSYIPDDIRPSRLRLESVCFIAICVDSGAEKHVNDLAMTKIPSYYYDNKTHMKEVKKL